MNNSTAEAVRVEAKLSQTSNVIAQFVLQMHNKKMYFKRMSKAEAFKSV